MEALGMGRSLSRLDMDDAALHRPDIGDALHGVGVECPFVVAETTDAMPLNFSTMLPHAQYGNF